MTTREAISTFRQRLQGTLPANEITAMMRIILDDVMHYSPVDAIIHEDDELPDFFPAKLNGIIERLLRHEPLQHIMGEARFHGLRLRVTEATLIPRPETEMLVDIIADQNPGADLRVLDVGTGSGCIAIALARTLKFASVTATDVSAEALAVARQNAIDCGVKVNFVQQDALSAPLPHSGEWDIVVSNPPYVTQSEKAAMEPNVLDYEPASALFVPDDDALRFYRAISRTAWAGLSEGGRLYFEINSAKGPQMLQLLTETGFANAQLLRDQYGKERFAIATKP